MFGNIPVWYYPDGVANISSLKTLKHTFHVTYDSNVNCGVFQVKSPGGTIEFKPYQNGLHCLNMNPTDESSIILVTTE